jgi:protein phosphatase PTC1
MDQLQQTQQQHKGPHKAPGFELGVVEDRNKRCRRTMEDAHTFIFNYMGIPRQGFFAIFDGHAGKATAEWCGANFDKVIFYLVILVFINN